MTLQMNCFKPVSSVIEQHAILLGKSGDVVYAGPLSGIDELSFSLAVQSLVHPATLAWIKAKADEAIRTGKVRL